MSKGTKAFAILVGRMGDAVKVRTSQGGKKIGNVRLACSEGYGDNETTSWFDVVIFDEKKVEVLEKFAGKGSRIYVSGPLRVRKWEKDNVTHYSTELVVSFEGSLELMDSKDDKPDTGTRTQSKPQSQEKAPAFGAFDTDLDDDVPF